MSLQYLNVDSFENEEYLVFSCFTDDGVAISSDMAKRFFSIDAQVINDTFVHEEIAVKLNEIAFANKQEVINENAARNFQFFDTEMDKLDQWADDMKISLEKEIKDLDAEIKLKKENRSEQCS